MKKLILAISVVMVGLYAKSYAAGPQWFVPEGDSQQMIQTADYGGVNYATSAFNTAVSSVTFSSATIAGRYVVYGAYFSTGPCSGPDWVDVYDSSNALVIPTGSGYLQPTARFYNLGGSTNTSVGSAGASCFGFSGPPKPIRFKTGLLWKVSTSNYNMVNLLYWKEER